MFTLGVILAVLLLLGFTRVGIRAAHTADGKTRLTLRAGLLRFNLLKIFERAKEKPEKPKKPGKEPKPKEEGLRFSPADIPFFFQNGGKSLRTLRKSIRIDRLILRVTFGGIDPCDTAMIYARSHMALGVLRPAVLRHLRVKKQEISVGVDFDLDKTRWSGDFAVTVSIGRLFLISFSLLRLLLKLTRRKAV
ncbi:MAG: DUF2953 domain-containing protein [Oscillospiraceae bacterium]|jgi:hypothetical protein|nr:DUF2953 domain-containing protein [Oscillospiraceae bacterium]